MGVEHGPGLTWVEDIRNIERINQVKVPLGRMSLEELTTLEQHCISRVVDAECELQIVRDYKDRRFPQE